MRRAVALAILLLLAGCSVGYTPEASTPTPEPTRIGVENGYRYDADLNVTRADGLNDTERAAVVARTIARVEYLRDVEFQGDVEVILLSRAEYRDRNVSFTRRTDRAADARWEATFMIGESTNASRVVQALFSGAVAGYYLPGPDRIVIVSESGDAIDTRTLAHELVHAIQDQRDWRVGTRDDFDGQLAATGLTEGEAVAVTQSYVTRCSDDWSCLSPPDRGTGNVSTIVTYPGVYLTFRAPYVTGGEFVNQLRRQGGWQAVTAAYDRPPESTRELLTPGVYPADNQPLAVPDRSADAWERYGTPDTVGQATLHAAFWTNGLVPREDDAIATDYRDPYSDGLRTDRFVPYRDGERDGYVWRLRFANASEAREFVDGYRRLLTKHDANRVRAGVYVVPEGPFADAFHVTRDDHTVTIVNGPTVDALDEIHR